MAVEKDAVKDKSLGGADDKAVKEAEARKKAEELVPVLYNGMKSPAVLSTGQKVVRGKATPLPRWVAEKLAKQQPSVFKIQGG